jgi:hypothetical protein
MGRNLAIESLVLERAMKPYPDIKEIVPFSTPVVSFGNPVDANVLTIGINPSSLEFLSGGKLKKVLPLGKKRLVDLEVLKVEDPMQLTEEMAYRVVEGCYNYFSETSKPYMTWFKHLDKNVNQFFGSSYRGFSAAHLDLVQWATDPVWGKIEDSNTRNLLLEGDVDFLRYQINSTPHKVVFLNGKQVFEQLTSNNIVNAVAKEPFTYQTKSGKSSSISFYHGSSSNGTPVVGWSRTFPGHHISDQALTGVVEKLHQHFKRYVP